MTMLNLPVHRLSNDEKASFQCFLKTMSRIRSYYIVDHNNTKCVFLYKSKAKEYIIHHNIDVRMVIRGKIQFCCHWKSHQTNTI